MKRTSPFQYQKEAAFQIERFGGRALVSLDTGLGKSYTSLLWSYWNHELRPIVIVCPASLKLNWSRECSTHFGLNSQVLSTNTPGKDSFFKNSKILIINYDILHSWVDVLRKLEPKIIILDECQKTASPRTRQSKATKKLCTGIPHVLGLSGTPLTNRPAELYNIVSILKPELFPKFKPYGDRFCQPRVTPWGIDYSGAARLPQLHKILKKELLIRVLKQDVIDELPPKQRFLVPLPMDREQEYWEAERNFLGWLAKQDVGKAQRASRAEKLTKFGYLKRLASTLKLRSACDWIQSFLKESGEKLIVFAEQRDILSQLESKFYHTCVMVRGGVSSEAKQLAVDQFQGDSRTRLFLGNIKAAGVGLTLTKASNVAFLELPWAPAHITQCEDRAFGRINDPHGLDSWFLVAAESVEDKVMRILQDKQEILDATLDGGKVSNTLNIFDLLEQTMSNKKVSKKHE